MNQHLHWKLTNSRTNAAYWLGAVALVYAMLAQWSWANAAIAFGIEALVITLYSAVTHRYFVHRAYEANSTVAFVLAIPGVLYSLASPVVFSAAHWTHHAYADTSKDSHHKGWRGVFTASFKDVPPRSLRAAHWFLDGKHEFLFRYAFAFLLSWWALLLAAGGVETLVWVGLIPTFLIHLFHGLHRSFGHDSEGGRRIWWAEFVLPMGGDWLHDEHHRNPKLAILSRRWYEIDPGAGVVRLLRLTA